MPNHVLNVLEFSGAQADITKLLEFIKNPENPTKEPIDFDRIIPMPESLNLESGSRTNDAISYYLSLQGGASDAEKAAIDKYTHGGAYFGRALQAMTEEERQEFESKVTLGDLAKALETGHLALHNLVNYDALTWYDWRIREWGTKWNAYEQKRIDDKLIFQTAWSPAEPVIKRLSFMFPDVRIKWRWADEDWGHNLGEVLLKAGHIVDGTALIDEHLFSTPESAAQWSKEFWEKYA